ncbi:hypothetical protein HanHA89_Chr01g0012951 [Helianthus annuus]|nr:hypothetical protein HanHA89_Chr01g0012951 [Helianthus annuus]
MLKEGSPRCIVHTKLSLKHWNENFFRVKKTIVPFEMPHRDPTGLLDLPTLQDTSFDFALFTPLKNPFSNTRPCRENVLVRSGISQLWHDASEMPIFVKGDMGYPPDVLLDENLKGVEYDSRQLGVDEQHVVSSSDSLFVCTRGDFESLLVGGGDGGDAPSVNVSVKDLPVNDVPLVDSA